jgi:hypothetical protein
MGERLRSPDPEICCDFNGRMTSLAIRFRDLSALGLTLDGAVDDDLFLYDGESRRNCRAGRELRDLSAWEIREKMTVGAPLVTADT